MMKAVIMAGGEGRRLRPLTCTLPKPMARLCGRPVVEYILDLLEKHGFCHAALTLLYLPQVLIHHFADGRYRNTTIDFVIEPQPLGTAGSVKNACLGSSDEGALVISGDALCDFDLTAALAFHRRHKAVATIVVKQVADPREYGLVQTDGNGRVTGFLEKPSFTQATGNLANSGVYILSPQAIALIPTGKRYDFAKDLFADILAKGLKLCAYEDDGYWCDIGDLGTYLRCQRDMLEGKVNCHLHGQCDKSGNIFKGDIPSGEYHLQAPVYIGEGVRLLHGVQVQRGTVIDDGCTLEQDCRVTSSVLLPNAYVGRGATLTTALLCENATVKGGAMLFEGSAVGAASCIGRGAVVNPSIKIWPHKQILDGSTICAHLKYAEGTRFCFDDDGLTGEAGVEITPETCSQLGAAVASVLHGRPIGVAHTVGRAGGILADALITGIRSAGSCALDLGAARKGEFDFFLDYCAVELGIFVRMESGGKASLQLTCAAGLPAPRGIERAVEASMNSGEFHRCPLHLLGDRVDMSGVKLLYNTQLLRLAPFGLYGISATVQSVNSALQSKANHLLEKLGAQQGQDLLFTLSEDGQALSLFYDGKTIPHMQLLLLCCRDVFAAGQSVSLPAHFPQGFEVLAEKYGVSVLRTLTCPADDSDKAARDLAPSQPWVRDPLMLLFRLVAQLCAGSATMGQLLTLLPPLYTSVQILPLLQSPAHFLSHLSAPTQACGEGVLLQTLKGTVLLRPTKSGKNLKLFSESTSSETALECGVLATELLFANFDIADG